MSNFISKVNKQTKKGKKVILAHCFVLSSRQIKTIRIFVYTRSTHLFIILIIYIFFLKLTATYKKSAIKRLFANWLCVCNVCSEPAELRPVLEKQCWGLTLPWLVFTAEFLNRQQDEGHHLSAQTIGHKQWWDRPD